MRGLALLVLYTALSLGANAADLATLKQGDMAKLIVADAPKPLPEVALLDETEAERSLSDYKGKVVLLNFWATWCAPCRKEMPGLDALQAEMGGDDFAVVTIATGRNPVPLITRFFDETGVKHLPKLRDPRQQLAGQMGIVALPVTVILDRNGAEVARLIGDAAWDAPEAKAVIAALIKGPA